MNVPLFVPKDPTSSSIIRGSAIVGGPLLDNGRLVIYFEGNKFNAQEGKRFVVRCMLAHGRMIKRYPTTAKMAILPDELIRIGEYDPIQRRVCVEEAERLADWLSVGTIPIDQLVY